VTRAIHPPFPRRIVWGNDADAGATVTAGSVAPSRARGPAFAQRLGAGKACVVAGIFAFGVLCAPGELEALPWNDDMKDQPSVKTQEAVVAMPQASVPSDGGDLDGPDGIQDLVRARIRVGETLSDPLSGDGADEARAALKYEHHCQSCHGAGGAGDGSVGVKYTPKPMDLTLPYVQNQPDGQLYYTITHGGVVMPGYRFALSQEDRWLIVRYLRGGLLEQAARLAEEAAAAESAGIESEAADGQAGAQAAQ